MSLGGAKRSEVDRKDDPPIFHSALPNGGLVVKLCINACSFLPQAVVQTSQLATHKLCEPAHKPDIVYYPGGQRSSVHELAKSLVSLAKSLVFTS